jgi:hypothetical protein
LTAQPPHTAQVTWAIGQFDRGALTADCTNRNPGEQRRRTLSGDDRAPMSCDVLRVLHGDVFKAPPLHTDVRSLWPLLTGIVPTT